MQARVKLNYGITYAAFVVAVIVGAIFGSFAMFVVTLIGLLSLAIHNKLIRL